MRIVCLFVYCFADSLSNRWHSPSSNHTNILKRRIKTQVFKQQGAKKNRSNTHNHSYIIRINSKTLGKKINKQSGILVHFLSKSAQFDLNDHFGPGQSVLIHLKQKNQSLKDQKLVNSYSFSRNEEMKVIMIQDEVSYFWKKTAT